MEFVTMPHDGAKIAVHIWDRVNRPKGVVQLMHGLNEHMGRYDGLARYLNEKGYIVVGDDHRAHGETAGVPDKVGVVSKSGDNFEDTVQDERFLTDWIAEKYRLPIVLIGHSYGSFLLQRYIFGFPLSADVAGIVLSGTAKLPGRLVSLGKLATAGDPNGKAKTIARFTFHRYDRKFKEGPNGWLSKDREIVRRYNEDPMTRDHLTRGFYYSFFSGVGRIFKKPLTDGLKEMPILILCGAKDGLGGYGRYSKALYRKYLSYGLRDVCFTLYPTDRHELFNETDRDRVYAEMTEHLDRAVAHKNV